MCSTDAAAESRAASAASTVDCGVLPLAISARARSSVTLAFLSWASPLARSASSTDVSRSTSGAPAGDPYGSMAYLSVVVPNQLNNGSSLPSVEVLVQGLLVPVYGTDGTDISDQFSSNPAWILLDVLRRSGWTAAEIDVTSSHHSAALSMQSALAEPPQCG